jgi:hypothetical protein
MYSNSRKVVYYYLTDTMVNNNKDAKRKYYRALTVETVYLDDNSLKYRNRIINYFKNNVLCIIDELKYMPPTKIGNFYFQGGYLYHEAKHDFEKNCR